jgi:hypothetical protein
MLCDGTHRFQRNWTCLTWRLPALLGRHWAIYRRLSIIHLGWDLEIHVHIINIISFNIHLHVTTRKEWPSNIYQNNLIN